MVAPRYQLVKRRVCLLALLCIAGGLELSYGALRWQDLRHWSQGFRTALAALATPSHSGPLVRGAIYDRRMKELAVSYAITTIHAHPGMVRDERETARRLAGALDMDSEDLERWLRAGGPLALPGGGIMADRAQDIEQMALPGIELRFGEERYYPQRSAAAHLLGYVEQKFGLSGIEGRYDTVLQPGVYRCAELPQLDCQGLQSPGALGSDVVLSVDLDVQRLLEASLAEHAREDGMIRGGAMVMETDGGALLAMASYPAYDLNHPWRADEGERRSIVQEPFVPPAAIRPLLRKAAAALQGRGDADEALPPLVTAPVVEADDDELLRVAGMVGLYDAHGCDLPQAAEERGGRAAGPVSGELLPASPLQLATALARLVNSGTPVEPYLLTAVFDREEKRYLLRHKRQPASKAYIRTLPAQRTSRVVRALQQQDAGQAVAMHTTVAPALPSEAGGDAEQRTLDLVVGLIPARSPRLVVLAVMERAAMLPTPRGQERPGDKMAGRLRPLALRIHATSRPADLSEAPPERDTVAQAVFLAERRLSRHASVGTVGASQAQEDFALMPPVVDMSLRRGLRQLAGRNLVIRVSGSGRIVSQQPAAGTRLDGMSECLLVLRPGV